MSSLHLVVISPEKKTLETEAVAVTLPTVDGEITILPMHAAIFALVKPGIITIKTKDGEEVLAGGGGFVKTDGKSVTLLLEFGVKADELNEAQINEAKKRAEEILNAKQDDTASALAQASLARSLLELKAVKHKRKL
jgi:F-type H+-transporting ATPase subunit epsilon